MRAEYSKFNDEWFKDCHKCGSHYGSDSVDGLIFAFRRDSTQSDGLDSTCKTCRAAYRKTNIASEQRRWNLYYAPGSANRKRHIVRVQTRKKYGSAKNQTCVLCGLAAHEWHHTEYKTDAVVAVCHTCHEAL
jgi:hypothetical protein